MGRFEFQVVKNYESGMKPQVRYASRTLCMSCHQNEATIFPRGPWQETNFNMQVARRIKDHHAVYHGVPANGPGNAGRFDSATDRANLFTAYQQIWNQGCASDTDADAGKSCRAQLLLGLLHHRLASVSRPIYEPPAYLSSLLVDNWDELWPDGLPIPQADLNDRLPPMITLDSALSPQLDPLTLRPPLRRWSFLRAAHQTIQGLSEGFLLDQDIELLNRHLYHLASARRVHYEDYQGDCQFGFESDGSTENWLAVDCSLKNGDEGVPLSLVGEFHIRSGGWLSKDMSWLYISDWAHTVRVSVAGRIGDNGAGSNLQLFKPYYPVYSRLWDDRLISQFEIHFDQVLPIAVQGTENYEYVRGRAGLRISDDLPVLERAVSKLLRRAKEGSFTGFNSAPFQGVYLMDALFAELGIPAPQEHSIPTPTGLKLLVDENEIASDLASLSDHVSQMDALQTFTRYCSDCHASETTLPPGFLAGPIEQVKARLRTCAPRIAFRLDMWTLKDDRRPKSPMPPLGYLHNASIDPAWWRSSEELNVLRDYIQSLIPTGTDGASDPPSLQHYTKLPLCLPG